MGQHKQKPEIAKWQQRKNDIDEAIAKRTLPHAPVDLSGMVATVTALHQSDFVVSDEEMHNILPLVDQSDDDVTQTPPSDSGMVTDTDTDDNDHIDFCDLCHKPAWLHKYC